MEVKFKFETDEKVKTCFDEVGVIDMCALDNTKHECYYVKLPSGKDSWFKVDQLSKVN